MYFFFFYFLYYFFFFFFFFNDTATTEIYTLSLHDALSDLFVGEPVFCEAADLVVLDEHIRLRRERSEEHTSELQSRGHLVCRLLRDKTKHSLPDCKAQRLLNGDLLRHVQRYLH